jgi:anti-anti-sigma factor
VARMHISEQRIGDITVLNLAGRLVLEEGDVPLRESIDALIGEGRVDVVLNIHDVTYMDSCGIGTLVAKYLSVRQRGGNMKLVCPSARCHHVLEITHLLPIFETYTSEEAAVHSFAGHRPLVEQPMHS